MPSRLPSPVRAWSSSMDVYIQCIQHFIYMASWISWPKHSFWPSGGCHHHHCSSTTTTTTTTPPFVRSFVRTTINPDMAAGIFFSSFFFYFSFSSSSFLPPFLFGVFVLFHSCLRPGSSSFFSLFFSSPSISAALGSSNNFFTHTHIYTRTHDSRSPSLFCSTHGEKRCLSLSLWLWPNDMTGIE